MTRGAGGVSQTMILIDKGGGGVQTPPKKDDIIYEQPLVESCIVQLCNMVLKISDHVSSSSKVVT